MEADRVGWGRVLAACLCLHLLLALPGRPGEWALTTFATVPVELLGLITVTALVPARWRRGLRRAALALVTLVLVLKLADLAAFAALGRPFDPVFDLHLAGAGWTLLTGAVGPGIAWAYAALALVLVALAIAAVDRALAVVATGITDASRMQRRSLATVGLLLLATAPVLPALRADNAALLAHKLRAGVEAVVSMRAFAREAAQDAQAGVATAELFRALRGRDVLFLVVESYGRSALAGERYAPTIRARLARFEAALAAAGYGARSGWLTSPVKGGQSWLAHATLLTGLEIGHQRRYAGLLASERRSLIHGFGRAGWRTVAVMPAITMPWPEGAWFGYDAVYASADLGYAGEPFNWVTMPDQYTLSALERLELDREGRAPVMAEVALISSHAPWTPIPPVLDWDAIGDGSVFTPYARSGDPPSVVWRDAERVREQYLEAVDYALANLASYVEAFGRDDLVLVVVGDHQPAPLVTGEGAGFEVPVHVIATPDVLAEIDEWGWSAGMRPAPDLPAWPMAGFRDRFVDAFSGPPAPPPTPVQASTTDSGA
jgi:hypothetical protein